jgi:transcriptional regulator with XRE-family HTH domain
VTHWQLGGFMTKRVDQGGGWPPTGFGRRLQVLREAAGLSQQELAAAAGCHLMTISKLERGVQEPAWPLVLALARALGVACTEFIQQAGEVSEARKPARPRKQGPAETPSSEKPAEGQKPGGGRRKGK